MSRPRLDVMPEQSPPLMDGIELSKARPLLWLLLVIGVLVFAAVAIACFGALGDELASSPVSQQSVAASAVLAVVLSGSMAWLIVALLRELGEWNRVIAEPRGYAELTGTVTVSRRAMGLPQFLSTTVQLDAPWKGHHAVRLLTTNGSSAGGGARTGELAAAGERLRIQVYDSDRRRKIAIAAPAGRSARRANLLF